MGIGSDLWNKFDNVRIFLCLFVVLRHCNPIELSGYDGGELVSNIIQFILKLRGVAVPAFFFISGFLLAHNHHRDNLQGYLTMLSKRFRSLVVPFVIWNLIAWTIRASIRFCVYGHFISPGEYGSVGKFLFDTFWVPENIPLGFIRNLVCFILLSPLLIYLVKRMGIIACVLFLIISAYFKINGLFYYGAGLYFASCLSVGETVLVAKPARCLLFVVLAYAIATTFYAVDGIVSDILEHVSYICGVLGFISLISGKKHTTRLTSQSLTFFIYCCHGIVAPYALLGLYKVIHPHGGFAWFVMFLLSFVVVSVLTISLWFMLKRIAPKITSILTGGRALQPHSPL